MVSTKIRLDVCLLFILCAASRIADVIISWSIDEQNLLGVRIHHRQNVYIASAGGQHLITGIRTAQVDQNRCVCDISYEDLSKTVSTSNPEDTRILEVSVEAASPEEAKRIVDAVCEVGTESITQAMGFQQVNLYEYGTIDTKPSNQTRKLTYALVGAVAAMLTYTAFLIFYLVDDTLRTDEDIQQYLGLTILGDIPNANSWPHFPCHHAF